MKLLTTDEIIQALKKEDVPITREQFNYYLKIGLLFAPEKKTKKRVKEGIKSFYAEESVKRLKEIYEEKKGGDTLEEIKLFFLQKDRESIVDMYKKAGVSLGVSLEEPKQVASFLPATLDDATVKVLDWRKNGYYKGLYSIYIDIIDKLKTDVDRILAQKVFGNLLMQKINREIQKQEECKIVERVVLAEVECLSKEDENISVQLKKVILEKYEPLHKFLILKDLLANEPS